MSHHTVHERSIVQTSSDKVQDDSSTVRDYFSQQGLQYTWLHRSIRVLQFYSQGAGVGATDVNKVLKVMTAARVLFRPGT